MTYNVLQEGVFQLTISVRLSKEESALFRKFAEMNNLSVSEMIRKTVMERIEDEYDLKIYREALEDFQTNPKTISLQTIEKELSSG